MIGLIGISPPGESPHGTVVLASLPPVPADRLSAAIVRAEDEEGVVSVLAWHEKVVGGRPTFPLGLVCPADSCAAPLGAYTYPVRLVLPPEDLQGGSLPAAALAAIRDISVEGLILEELLRKHGDAILTERRTVECLISHAVRGGTLNAVAAELRCATTSVWRRLTAISLKPRATMSWARLRAYHLAVELGAHPDDARRAGGWYSRRAWEKAVVRGRQGTTTFSVE